MSLAKQTVKNSAYNLVAFLWPLALAFFSTPIVVKHLGQEYYGLLALVTSFIGFFAVLDFGVAPSLVKYVSELSAKKEYTRLNRVFSASLFFYLLIGVVGAIIIACTAGFFSHLVLKDSTINASLGKTVFYIAAVGFLINMVLSAFSALPSALQRFDLTSKINLSISTTSTVITILLVLSGYGIIALASLSVAMSCLALVIYRLANKRLLPELKITTKVKKEDFKIIFGFSSFAFVATLSGIVIAEFDRIFLGATLGPAAVTYYVIPGNLTIKILGFVVAAATIVFPLSASLLAKNKLDKVNALYQRASRVIVYIMVIGLCPMLVFAHKFLFYWLGADYATNSTLILQVLLLTYVISSLHVVPYLTAYGAGKPKYNAVYALSVAVLNILFMIIFVPKWGMNGAAWAYLGAVVPTTLYFVYYVERKVLKVNRSRTFWLPLLGRVLFAIVLSLILAFIGNLFITSLWLFVAIYAAVVLLTGAIFLLLRLAEPEDMNLLKELFSRFGIPFLKRS